MQIIEIGDLKTHVCLVKRVSFVLFTNDILHFKFQKCQLRWYHHHSPAPDARTHGRTDGRTDVRTDVRTDGRKYKIYTHLTKNAPAARN